MPRYRAQYVSTWQMDVEVLADNITEAEEKIRANNYNGSFSEEMTGIVSTIDIAEIPEEPPQAEGGEVSGGPPGQQEG